jgi:hypothetical protein
MNRVEQHKSRPTMTKKATAATPKALPAYVGRKCAPHLIPRDVPDNFEEDDDDQGDDSASDSEERQALEIVLPINKAVAIKAPVTTLSLDMFAATSTADRVKVLGTTTGMATSPAEAHKAFYMAADKQLAAEEKELTDSKAKKMKANTFGVKGFAVMLNMVETFATIFQTKPGEFDKTMRYAPRLLPIKMDGQRMSGKNLRSTAKITQDIFEFELAMDATVDFSRSTIAQVYVANNTMDGFETNKTGPVVKNGWVEFLPSVAAVRHATFTRVIYYLTPVFKYTAGKSSTPMMLLPPPLVKLRDEMFSCVDMPAMFHDGDVASSVKNEVLMVWQEGDYGSAKQFTSLLKIYTTYCSQLTVDADEDGKMFANVKKVHMVAVPCVGRVVDMQSAFLSMLMGQDQIARLFNKPYEKTMPLEMLAAGAFMMITVNTAIKTSEMPTVNSVVEVDADGVPIVSFADFDADKDVYTLSESEANEIVRTEAVAKRVVTGDYPLFDNMNKRGASSIYVEQLAAAIADNGVAANKVLASQGFALTAMGYKLQNLKSMMMAIADRFAPGSEEHAALMGCMDHRDTMTTRELVANQESVRAATDLVQEKLLKDQVALQQKIDELTHQNMTTTYQKKHTEVEVELQKTTVMQMTAELDMMKRLVEKAEADATKWRVLNVVINECGGAALQGGYQCARFSGVNVALMGFIKGICESIDSTGDFNDAVCDVLTDGLPSMVSTLLEVKDLDTMFVHQLDGMAMTEAECIMKLCVNPASFLERVWQTAMEKQDLAPDKRSKYLASFLKDKLHMTDSVVQALVKNPRSGFLDYFNAEPNKRPHVKRKDDDDAPSSPPKRARK